MGKVAVCLWFDNQAEQAAEFYTSLIGNSAIRDITRDAGGSVIDVTFDLDGQHFIALNGGPQFTFTEATSIYVTCQSQAEVDELWTRLTDGGSEGECGWLRDRYGLSWQIVPSELHALLGDPDADNAQRAMTAMRGMKKINIKALKDAVR